MKINIDISKPSNTTYFYMGSVVLDTSIDSEEVNTEKFDFEVEDKEDEGVKFNWYKELPDHLNKDAIESKLHIKYIELWVKQ